MVDFSLNGTITRPLLVAVDLEIWNHQYSIEFLVYCMNMETKTGFVTDNIQEIRVLFGSVSRPQDHISRLCSSLSPGKGSAARDDADILFWQ